MLADYLTGWWSFGNGIEVIDESFGRSEFLLLLLFPMGLVVSGSLVLPSRVSETHTDLLEYFVAEGKWGAAAYAGTITFNFVAAIYFFGISESAPTVEGIPAIFPVFPLSIIITSLAVAMSASARRIQILTLVAAVLQIIIMTMLGMALVS